MKPGKAKLPLDPGPDQINAALGGSAQAPAENIRQEVAEQGPQTVAEKLYAATTSINAAKLELDKLQGQYNPDHAAWGQCETIDDHLFEALRLLGQ